jgi:hypothetical protein
MAGSATNLASMSRLSRYLRVSDWFAGERMDGLREVGIGPDRGC